ncbi:MAG: hypothetical protein H7Z41_01295 [Cytophagales bacterium]|nr:hypothetical protein [Armatimonadota bacterium]
MRDRYGIFGTGGILGITHLCSALLSKASAPRPPFAALLLSALVCFAVARPIVALPIPPDNDPPGPGSGGGGNIAGAPGPAYGWEGALAGVRSGQSLPLSDYLFVGTTSL